MSRSQFTGFCIAPIVLAFSSALADTPSPSVLPASEVIRLPKYEVTTDRVLPPIEQWKYVSIPGFEILSNASERNTKLFVQDFYLLRQVAQIILPSVKETTPVPTYIVLCGQGSAFETFAPSGKMPRSVPNGMFVSDAERSAIVIDFTFQDPSGNFHAAFGNGNDPFHAFYLQYFRELIHNSVKPAPPTWLEEGLVQLLAATDFSPKTIVVGKVGGDELMSRNLPAAGGVWNNHGVNLNGGSGGYYGGAGDSNIGFSNAPFAAQAAAADPMNGLSKPGSFNTALAHRPIMPLEQFFAYDRRLPGSHMPLNYTEHAYLFTHLCLYGRGQRYNKAFFALAQCASKGPVTEGVFKECFGITFAEMEKVMRSYVSFTDYKSVERRALKGHELATAPGLKLRAATDAESSRIAGEVLRLTGQREAALNRLIAPYVRGQYDADLLAALGLAELDAKHKERAQRFLEAAAKANTTRTRAYVELAGLRLEEIIAKTAAENRAVTPEEFAWLQAPLHQGLTHPPALAALYDLLARTWYLSPQAPTQDQFNLLAAGARQNSTDLGLVYRVAAVGLKFDHLETSRQFVRFGVDHAPDSTTKTKFEQLAMRFPSARETTATK